MTPVRDHREVTILLRAEVSALAGLLISKGLVSAVELTDAFTEECEALDAGYEEKFPGARTTEDRVVLDPRVWRKTTKGWLP